MKMILYSNRNLLMCLRLCVHGCVNMSMGKIMHVSLQSLYFSSIRWEQLFTLRFHFVCKIDLPGISHFYQGNGHWPAFRKIIRYFKNKLSRYYSKTPWTHTRTCIHKQTRTYTHTQHLWRNLQFYCLQQ